MRSISRLLPALLLLASVLAQDDVLDPVDPADLDVVDDGVPSTAEWVELPDASPNAAARLASPVSSENIVTRSGQRWSCKCYPGDSCYPSTSKWNALKAAVGGRLQSALPPAAHCYNKVHGISTYNAKKCQDAQTNAVNEQWHTDHPISIMWPFHTNETCPLDTATRTGSCTRGYYGDYVILAKTARDIQEGVKFARNNNVRLVIRNTGHDFMGRSTGYGSLIINTHSFKKMSFTKRYTGPGSYRGGAVTVGAGIQVGELYKKAYEQRPPVVVVGGECRTVGFAGGYLQGGGHGPMASFYGMGADHALSFDVVTADGQYVTANQACNSDLYWALKGGGPSTFGVVVAITVKTHPEVPTAAIMLDINETHTTDRELYWKGVSAFHDQSNHWTAHKMFGYFEVGPWPGRFHMWPLVGPNMTAARINELAQPMWDALAANGVPYSSWVKGYPTFYQMYADIFEDELPGSAVTGGRLFTTKDMDNNAQGIVDAYRVTLDTHGAFVIGHVVGPGQGAPVVDNAIHPAWRRGSVFTVTSFGVSGTASTAEKQRVKALNTANDNMWKAAAPDGAMYVNEGDLEADDWQDQYWGSNYPRLLSIKRKFDRKGIFYAQTTPGTENWKVIDYETRLCKKL